MSCHPCKFQKISFGSVFICTYQCHFFFQLEDQRPDLSVQFDHQRQCIPAHYLVPSQPGVASLLEFHKIKYTLPHHFTHICSVEIVSC